MSIIIIFTPNSLIQLCIMHLPFNRSGRFRGDLRTYYSQTDDDNDNSNNNNSNKINSTEILNQSLVQCLLIFQTVTQKQHRHNIQGNMIASLLNVSQAPFVF